MSKIKKIIAFYKKNGKEVFIERIKHEFKTFPLEQKIRKIAKKLAIVNQKQKDLISNWVYFSELNKKYKTFLQSLPRYESHNDGENPKIIWWCWLQGEENAPKLCKSCLASLKHFYPDYKINVVTDDNLWDLVEIPDYIKNKYQKGLISRTHFSDILRTCLLVKYGGVWADSTVLCTSRFGNILDYPLFFYKNFGDESCVLSSWFISSQANNPILRTAKDLLFEFWRTNNYLYHYFIYHFFCYYDCFKISRRI